jgi:glycosyltransferase involved in cell wall biosynthesis
MRIGHIFYSMNEFGGAEEHLTTLAELQRAHGDEVTVFLVQAARGDNQYVQRLRCSGVRMRQWPLWLSLACGDWETSEAILRYAVAFLWPAITVVSAGTACLRRRRLSAVRPSVEGRVRTIVGRMMRRERECLALLLAWHHAWRRFDVLHLHSYGAALDFVVSWCRKRDVPVVYQEHSTPDGTPRRHYGRPRNIDDASIVVAVSETSARALRREWGVTRTVRVIPPIAGQLPLSPGIRVTRTTQDCAIRVVTIARLSREKGLGYLVSAAERVVASRPNVAFSIHGDGDLYGDLKAQIERAGIGASVFLSGAFARRDLPLIMGDADLFVLPSVTEGYPLCIVEAMAWGLPIVATAVGGVPELLQDGVTGLLCAPCDPDALAAAVLELVDKPNRARELGTAAREAYAVRLGPERVVDMFADAYAEAVRAG